MVTAARNRKKTLGSISGHESSIMRSARALKPTASPYQGKRGQAECRRRVRVDRGILGLLTRVRSLDLVSGSVRIGCVMVAPGPRVGHVFTRRSRENGPKYARRSHLPVLVIRMLGE